MLGEKFASPAIADLLLVVLLSALCKRRGPEWAQRSIIDMMMDELSDLVDDDMAVLAAAAPGIREALKLRAETKQAFVDFCGRHGAMPRVMGNA